MYRIVRPVEDADDHARCLAAILALDEKEPGNFPIAHCPDGTCYPWVAHVPSGGFGEPAPTGFELRLVSPAADGRCLLRFTELGAAALMQDQADVHDTVSIVGTPDSYSVVDVGYKATAWLLRQYGCTPPFKTSSMLDDMY